jgi:hypothetical protein
MSTIFSFAGKQITIYCGIPVLIGGIIGGLLNTLVFLSLRTFRQSSCAFYLTIMSIFNIGQLCTGLLSRIMVALLGYDGTQTSLFYCKFRLYLFQVCMGVSLTCMCLATIDQYFATCTRPRWQQFCNIKLAQRLVMATILIWILQGIPYFVYFVHIQSSLTNTTTCTTVNFGFSQYRSFVIFIVLQGYLPVSVAALFGSIAFRNVQQMAYRTIPLVRRELDKQLTVMVLIEVVMSIFTLLPYTTINGIATNTSIISDPATQARLQTIASAMLALYYTYFAVSVKESVYFRNS